MIILGLDFETSGLNPKKDRVLEVGMALWDVENKRAVRQTDFLVHPGLELPDKTWTELSPIHGVHRYMVEKYGVTDSWAITEVDEYVMAAEAIIAHNGTDFDRLFHLEWEERYGRKAPPVGWIDTRLDVPEPMTGPLITQCAKRGFLNPFPHQALSDVLSMLRLLSDYDIEAVVERSKIPNVHVQSNVSFYEKELAKERGYFWKPETKQWLKRIKACDVEKERQEAPFKIREVEVQS